MFSRYLEAMQKPFYHFCYVGKFSPFHKAHKYMYDYLNGLISKYKLDGKVYICTRFDDNDFLSSTQKIKIIQLSGVPLNNIINHSGYSIKGLLSAVNGTDDDVMITAFSQKDLDDGSKFDFMKMPKDNITSWRIIKNENDIPFLRPVKFVHSEYKDVAEKKVQKGTGYVIVVPTQQDTKGIISSSAIRKLISIDDWESVRKLMVNDSSYEYLRGIKHE